MFKREEIGYTDRIKRMRKEIDLLKYIHNLKAGAGEEFNRGWNDLDSLGKLGRLLLLTRKHVTLVM